MNLFSFLRKDKSRTDIPLLIRDFEQILGFDVN